MAEDRKALTIDELTADTAAAIEQRVLQVLDQDVPLERLRAAYMALTGKTAAEPLQVTLDLTDEGAILRTATSEPEPTRPPKRRGRPRGVPSPSVAAAVSAATSRAATTSKVGQLLAMAEEPMTVRQLADAIGQHRTTIDAAIAAMAVRGEVVQVTPTRGPNAATYQLTQTTGAPAPKVETVERDDVDSPKDEPVAVVYRRLTDAELDDRVKILKDGSGPDGEVRVDADMAGLDEDDSFRLLGRAQDLRDRLMQERDELAVEDVIDAEVEEDEPPARQQVPSAPMGHRQVPMTPSKTLAPLSEQERQVKDEVDELLAEQGVSLAETSIATMLGRSIGDVRASVQHLVAEGRARRTGTGVEALTRVPA